MTVEQARLGRLQTVRLIESMTGLRPRKRNLGLVFRLFSLTGGLPSIRLKQSENEPC